MKNGWKTKQLGGLCDVLDHKRKPITKRDRQAGEYPYYGATGVLDYVSGYLFDEPLVLVGEDGAKWASGEHTAFAVDGKIWVNNHAHVLRPHRTELLDNWLIYYLNHTDLTKFVSGLTVPKLNQGSLREIPIPVPTLAEQRRIVGFLDNAFAGIVTAKANSEKNLQNARALFESHLQLIFSQRGPGWVDRNLASLCHEITVGHVGPMKTQYKESGIPFLRSQNIRPFQVSLDNAIFIDETFHRALKKSQLRPGDLAIVRTGYPGTAAVIPPELPDSNCSDLVIVRPSKEVNPHFLAAFFNSAFGKQLVLGKIVGAAQKHFNITAAKEVMLHVPPMTEQTSIIQKVDHLCDTTQRLVSICERKLAALEALKSSLLHQAFTGELNWAAETIEPVESIVTSFPIQIPNISPTDLHAGVLAMAFQMHEQHGKQDFFGHVKAEKIAHMVEASLGIDLGRSPVKDAAGPNDFPHLVKVEHRARMANFFNFKRVDGSEHYSVQKLHGFQRLIDKTGAALGSRCDKVERLLQLMLPMTAKQAEIMATAFAAWNNLLLDGKQPTDEQIVSEARESWHPDKLKIDRQKFFAAVQWLREKDVVPEGKGKKVESKRK